MVKVNVDVEFLRTDQSGRRTPPSRVYAPLISWDQEAQPRPTSVVLTIDVPAELGRSIRATLAPLVEDLSDEDFWPGRSFSLWEGNRRVASGIIVSVDCR